MIILSKIICILADAMTDHCIIGHIDRTLQVDSLTMSIFVLDVKGEGNVLATDVTDGDIIGKGQLASSDLLLDLVKPFTHPGQLQGGGHLGLSHYKVQ